MYRYNLLNEPLISIQCGRDDYSITLPEVFSNLSNSNIKLQFPGLRAHQVQSWYSFLVQLAAMLLYHSQDREENLITDPSIWKERLLRLSGGRETPWCLIVEDLAEPAFFQPPTLEDALNIDKRVRTPDDLDILDTAKNHDVKKSCVYFPKIEYWIYSIITLQTMSHYFSPGKYGISRMNGGRGRPFVGYIPSLDWGERFRRDVLVLLNRRNEVIEKIGFATNNGKTLLWCDPWDGSTSLSILELDPYFLEICRRVRFLFKDEKIIISYATSKRRRVNVTNRNGDLGDPWIPIDKFPPKSSKFPIEALGVGKNGFDFTLVQELIFGGKFERGIAQQIYENDPESMFLYLTSLGRLNNKPTGFHTRIIPIPTRIRTILGGGQDGRDRIGKLSKKYVEIVTTVKESILSPSLYILLNGKDKNDKKKKTNGRDKEIVSKWCSEFDKDVDNVFFKYLWETVSANENVKSEESKWIRCVVGLAEKRLNIVKNKFTYLAFKYRRISSANNSFYCNRNNNFPDLYGNNNAATTV
ncbi:MAG: hypothetical protein ACW98F_12285 [Candidatus Hodarchaeales archaeon]|jgi:CRISPR system Cascade subunit CasA